MLNKKKLCIILPHHWSHMMGGSEYQIKCLLESHLLQKYFDIFILSRKLGNAFSSNDYRLVRIVRPYPFQSYSHFIDAPFLLRRLNEITPDVIYQNIGTSYAGISAYFARKSGCKMALHIASDNNIVPHNFKRNIKYLPSYIEKKAFDYAVRNSTKLIAQTYVQKRLIHKHYNRSADAVIYNFQPIPIEKIDKHPPLKVLWIANFKKLKQPELFIDLANEVSSSMDAEFIMIGRPSPYAQWQEYLDKRISNIPKLKYLGEKSNEEINQILAGSHILVNTSLYEGFSNTFIQAWMRGVPVVSLHSNPDGMLNGSEMGFYSGSYDQLRQNVTLLLNDDKLRNKLSNGAREASLRLFTMQNAEKLLEILVD